MMMIPVCAAASTTSSAPPPPPPPPESSHPVGSGQSFSSTAASTSSNTISVIAGRTRMERLSWGELRQSVRDIRTRFSNLCKKVPVNFTFREVSTEHGARIRLYFLSVPNGGRETTLMFVDLPEPSAVMAVSSGGPSGGSGCDGDGQSLLAWLPLLESTFPVFSFLGMVSKEEQLQWERKRLVTWGIASYELHLGSGRFVFPACGSLYTCEDSGLQATPHFPLELKTSFPSARLNPQVCPCNPELVSFASNGDVWVRHTGFDTEQRLTFVHKGSKVLAEDPISAGLPPYVIQEEFHRYTGVWWQPSFNDGIYRILYEEVDEGDVEILYLVSQCSEDQGVDEFRFPRAGTPNAKSCLKMLQFELDGCGQFVNVRNLILRENLDTYSPWMEYLVRVGWTPEGNFVWAQCLNRQQTHLELVLIPMTEFICGPDDYSVDHAMDGRPTTILTLVQEITTDVWINVHDMLYFFPMVDDFTLTFLWADETTGFRHLYLINANLNSAVVSGNHVRDCPKSSVINNHDSFIFDSCDLIISKRRISNLPGMCNLRILRKLPLTQGDWEVLGKQIWVDEKRELVYFTGLKSSPLEKHLYVVSLAAPGECHPITASGFSHMVSLNKECSRFVSVYSSISQLPACQVFSIDWPKRITSVHDINVRSLGFLLEPSQPDDSYRQPELFAYTLPSQQTLYGMIFTPPNMQPGCKYPTVLSVYGGPEVQMVNNSFKGMRQLRLHMLAACGYVVVVIDNRGSRHRGVKFESFIKGRMGTVEIQDQVEMLQWLDTKTGFIDMSRVAVHGWSYGGYLSLMALAQRPDIFKMAVAGAPVTSWTLYDTAYTERYMDLPAENARGYFNGSVLSYIHSFPNEENRLLIIHGLIDENVHFMHTSQLINALIKAGKPYQLQVYPSERHSLRHLDASEHYETSLLSFLQQHL